MKKNKIMLVILSIFALMIGYSVAKIYKIKQLYINSINSSLNNENKIIDLSYFYVGDKKQQKRSISKITGITIHHSASTIDNSIRDIYDYQCDKFAKIGICYNYIIRKNGDIVKCHNFDELLTHAPNANTTDIAICLDGSFDKEKPSEEQINSLKYLVSSLKDIFNIKYVRGHQDVEGNATACPGINLEKIIKDL